MKSIPTIGGGWQPKNKSPFNCGVVVTPFNFAGPTKHLASSFSGVAIHPRIILTTQHCVDQNTSGFEVEIESELYQVARVCFSNDSSVDESDFSRLLDWNVKNVGNSELIVALIFTKEITSDINFAVLSNESKSNSTFYVIGIGGLPSDHSGPKIGNVSALDGHNDNSKIDNNSGLPYVSGALGNGFAFVSDDSGGGLLEYSGDVIYVRGITVGCTGSIGFFTKITKEVINWLTQIRSNL
jgi:hypothetical protein